MDNYYLILTCYVGPNDLDSRGQYHEQDGVMTIETEPVCGNLSGEPIIDGWAGTTNDVSRYGYGQFDTLEAARAAAAENGYTEMLEDHTSVDESEIEAYVTERDALDQWDAEEWLSGDPGWATGVTDRAALIDLANNLAAGEVYLHDLEDYVDQLITDY